MNYRRPILIVVASLSAAFPLPAQEPPQRPDPAPPGGGDVPFPPRRVRDEQDRGPRPEREGDQPGQRRPFGRDGERDNGPGPRDGNPGPRDGVPGPQDNDPNNPRPGLLMRVREKLQPYVGIISRSATPELAAQLKQTEGFGLIVDEVFEDSPAKAAGIEKNDLLLKFDDQLLVNPPQLEALVRRAGKDKEAVFSVLRAGEEKKISVKIGEKMMPERRPVPAINGLPQPLLRDPARSRERERDEREQRPFPGERPNAGRENPERRDTQYLVDRARLARRDAEGTYELQNVDGKREFIVKRPDGTEVWRGPVDTEEQRAKMPPAVREKLMEVERARAFERLGDRPEPVRPDGR